MSLENIMTIATSGMTAQTVRLNTIASNLANANSVAGSEDEAYRAKLPVFQAAYVNSLSDNNLLGNSINDSSQMGVSVSSINQSDAPIRKEYSPNNPLADEEGNIFHSNVNQIDEMTNMIDAQRQYRLNVEMFNATKSLLAATNRLMEAT